MIFLLLLLSFSASQQSPRSWKQCSTTDRTETGVAPYVRQSTHERKLDDAHARSKVDGCRTFIQAASYASGWESAKSPSDVIMGQQRLRFALILPLSSPAEPETRSRRRTPIFPAFPPHCRPLPTGCPRSAAPDEAWTLAFGSSGPFARLRLRCSCWSVGGSLLHPNRLN